MRTADTGTDDSIGEQNIENGNDERRVIVVYNFNYLINNHTWNFIFIKPFILFIFRPLEIFRGSTWKFAPRADFWVDHEFGIIFPIRRRTGIKVNRWLGHRNFDKNLPYFRTKNFCVFRHARTFCLFTNLQVVKYQEGVSVSSAPPPRSWERKIAFIQLSRADMFLLLFLNYKNDIRVWGYSHF